VIGVGNAYRGDDAVGLAVAERVRGRVPEDVAVLDCEQEPTRLLDAWSGADVAVVVDACWTGGAPGSVHRYDVSEAPLPARTFRSSTHAFGVADAIELSRTLGRLPGRVIVYGVVGGGFEAGAALSPHVQSAVDRVELDLAAEVGDA
jgi:hydrogenase maturation protease